MVCQVIKTIKGHQYLYEQTSYRIDGKVKTETRYIGAVDGVTGKVKANPRVQELEAQITHDTGEVIKEGVVSTNRRNFRYSMNHAIFWLTDYRFGVLGLQPLNQGHTYVKDK